MKGKQDSNPKGANTPPENLIFIIFNPLNYTTPPEDSDLRSSTQSEKVHILEPLLIVVGMFLTGFDAPTLNTLFVDKNVKNHGLILSLEE